VGSLNSKWEASQQALARLQQANKALLSEKSEQASQLQQIRSELAARLEAEEELAEQAAKATVVLSEDRSSQCCISNDRALAADLAASSLSLEDALRRLKQEQRARAEGSLACEKEVVSLRAEHREQRRRLEDALAESAELLAAAADAASAKLEPGRPESAEEEEGYGGSSVPTDDDYAQAVAAALSAGESGGGVVGSGLASSFVPALAYSELQAQAQASQAQASEELARLRAQLRAETAEKDAL
jgi:hypothetical protein